MMEIETVRNYKDELERAIADAMTDFYKKTGLEPRILKAELIHDEPITRASMPRNYRYSVRIGALIK